MDIIKKEESDANSQLDPGKKLGKKFFNKRFLLQAVILLLILSGLWLFYNLRTADNTTSKKSVYPTDAPELFDKMIDQSLLTSFMSEQRVLRDASGKELSKDFATYDLTDMKKVRIFGTSEGILPAKPTEKYIANYISVPEGVYMSYKKLGSAPENQLGHWFNLIEGSDIDSDGNALFVGQNPRDIALSYMGFYIPGIYTVDARNQVKDFIKNEGLYEFFSEYVRAENVNGKKYYAYEIELDSIKFRKFNKLVGNLFETKLTDSIGQGAEAVKGRTKFWVNVENARLERVDMTFDNNYSQTIYYYDYNVASDIRIPNPRAPSRFVRQWLEPYLASSGLITNEELCQRNIAAGKAHDGITLSVRNGTTYSRVIEMVRSVEHTAIQEKDGTIDKSKFKEIEYYVRVPLGTSADAITKLTKYPEVVTAKFDGISCNSGTNNSAR